MTDIQADITIIGGGMVGLSTALALKDQGASVCLVDNLATPADAGEDLLPFSPRVSALTTASIDWLTDLGAWQHLPAERISPFSQMQVWDGEGTGHIHFDAAEVYADSLGAIVENNQVVQALDKALKENDSLTLLKPDSLVEMPAADTLLLESGRTICSRLIIGADGGRSRVRELASFKLREWDYPHHAIVTTVTTEKPLQHTAWQRFMKTGPLAFLPLKAPAGDDRHFASIVWSCEPALCEALMALDDQAFCKRLGQAFEHQLGNVTATNQRFSFPLTQRHATDYVKAGIALIGDAAHTIHPLAGQGVNLGLQDAKALADVLIKALQARENIGHVQVLSRYQRQRKVHNLGMMTAMEGFSRLFSSDGIELTWLRNAGMNAFNAVAPVRKQIMRRAMGL